MITILSSTEKVMRLKLDTRSLYDELTVDALDYAI